MIGRAAKNFYGTLSARQNFHTIVSKEVNKALVNQQPVLALESTIITHGLPNPENLHMAQSVEDICRSNGVTPATIAVMRGSPCIGISSEELSELSNGSKSYVKISRRDLAPTIQQKLTGGTTVSGTMVLADQHNIPVFATGGIGGVHRGGEDTLDISADLTELGRTPVAVVCAGVKSILDIAKTLEYLETQGVTVATFGETRDFPAFFTAKSGLLSHTNVRTAKETAEMIYVNKQLNLGSGIVIAVPIPEQFSADGLEIENAIQTALKEANDACVAGNLITPFILQRVSELTYGRSLKTNLALVRNNVHVGSQIALELSRIQRLDQSRKVELKSKGESKDNKILVVGAVNVDILCTKHEEIAVGKDLVQGNIQHVMGGVARNVAECLAKQDINSTLISVVGDDNLGRLALECCKESGMDTTRIVAQPGASTPVAQLTIKAGDVLEGICNFSAHSYLLPNLIPEADIASSRFVVLDCDTPVETGLYVAENCSKLGVPLILEPTAPTKFKQYVGAGILQFTSMVTPNVTELAVITDDKHDFSIPNLRKPLPKDVSEILPQMLQCLSKMSRKTQFRSVLTTLGEKGVLYCQLSEDNMLQIVHLPKAPENPNIKSSSGAGDSFLGGFIANLCKGNGIEQCLKVGTFCAFKSLKSYDTISEVISDDGLAAKTIKSWNELGWNLDIFYEGEFKFEK